MLASVDLTLSEQVAVLKSEVEGRLKRIAPGTPARPASN
jgi:hypothetical protein